MFKPRDYQEEAVNKAVSFFQDHKRKGHEVSILPTGSGKSVVIAEICKRLTDGEILVLQPSVEILVQNFKKFTASGGRAGIYSASAGYKHKDRVTFAMIGSIIKKFQLFKDVKYIIVDECHLVNHEIGMYRTFFDAYDKVKILGMTATPYRLYSDGFNGAQLRFITRARPKVFSRVNYHVETGLLFERGYLCPLKYYDFTTIDRGKLVTNSSSADFDERALRRYYDEIGFEGKVAEIANRILKASPNLLVFCTMISEARKVSSYIPGSVVLTGETKPDERKRILSQFTSGQIKCVLNVGVLTTGFDYPELKSVLIARSTMSLSLYYQMIGRAIRPHPSKKEAWIIDMGGNVALFGKVEHFKIDYDEQGKIALFQTVPRRKQLTNVSFTKK